MNDLTITQYDTLPPHNVESEKCTLASFAVDTKGDIRRAIHGMLKPEAFYLHEHATIARAFWDMMEAERPIDIVLLREELAKRNQLEEVGGSSYLAEILNAVPSPANGVYYAKIVKDKAARRWLIGRATILDRAARDDANEPIKIAAALRESLEPFIERHGEGDGRAGGASELQQRLTGLVDGSIRNVEFPNFPKLSKATQALLPGSMAMLVGVPGDGKTFAMLSWILGWAMSGINVSVLMCEQTRAWHLTRLLAMVSQNPKLLDDDWCRSNGPAIADLEASYREVIELVGKSIHIATINSMSLSDAGDWVEAEAAKSRVVILDPVTALDSGDQQWKEDKRFAARTKKAMERHGSSAILVTHPKKGTRVNGLIGLDDIAGGQAYQAFSDCVMSIYKHEPRKDVEIKKNGYPEQLSINRRIHIGKARNGVGGGSWLAADFSNTLQWGELGFITREIKKRETLDIL